MRRRLVRTLTQPASVANPWGVAEARAAFLLEQDPLALAAPRARAQMEGRLAHLLFEAPR